MRIVWSPLALERIDEIASFIAQNNLNAAKKWLNSVFRKVNELKRFPKKGRWVQETNRSDIREIIDGHYRIIYRLESKQIAVLTVRHTKQLLPLGEVAHAQDIEVPETPMRGLIDD